MIPTWLEMYEYASISCSFMNIIFTVDVGVKQIFEPFQLIHIILLCSGAENVEIHIVF